MVALSLLVLVVVVQGQIAARDDSAAEIKRAKWELGKVGSIFEFFFTCCCNSFRCRLRYLRIVFAIIDVAYMFAIIFKYRGTSTRASNSAMDNLKNDNRTYYIGSRSYGAEAYRIGEGAQQNTIFCFSSIIFPSHDLPVWMQILAAHKKPQKEEVGKEISQISKIACACVLSADNLSFLP